MSNIPSGSKVRRLPDAHTHVWKMFCRREELQPDDELYVMVHLGEELFVEEIPGVPLLAKHFEVTYSPKTTQEIEQSIRRTYYAKT